MGISMGEQRGITILEIMIAVAIIGVGLVALSSAIPIAAYGIQEGNQLSTATFLANQRLEQVRNAMWTACPAVDNRRRLGIGDIWRRSDGGVTTFPDENALPAPYGGIRRQVRITDVAAPLPARAASSPAPGPASGHGDRELPADDRDRRGARRQQRSRLS